MPARGGAVGEHDVALLGPPDEDLVLVEGARGGGDGIANGEDDLGHRRAPTAGFFPAA